MPASYRLTDGCGDIDPCCGCFLQHFAGLAQKALALSRRQLPGSNHDDRYFAPLLACGKGVQKLEPVHFGHHQIEQNHGRVWMVYQPGQSQADVHQIAEASHRASQVIEGIRSMFKNDGREKALLDVNEVIREVIALLRSELQNRQIVVQDALSPKLPPVLADGVQLQQVIAILVANAIEAMEAVNNRTLRVKSAISEADGVLIMVEDSGPGIDPENADRIFHPFFTTKSQGMGMGLSICRSIVEAHNGYLSARSALPRGSVFQISLPAGAIVGAG